MIYKNIGIKARCKNPEEILKFLDQSKSKNNYFDIQKDIYFDTKNENDDIRKIKKGNFENSFIGYKKRENSDLLEKDAHIIELRKDPPGQLEKIARKTHDILGETEKTRHTYLINNIKINIDKVKDLPGNYISIESIKKQENFDLDSQRKQVEHYKDLLEIREKDLIFDSYIDMLNKK
ncbi:MAG TPA: CYTH domain-containing protein [Candidatus Nanoarchaeia archaeon]|nr:CYTH domain-containing protein [Candidatus Nanoarchaeia archaeon]